MSPGQVAAAAAAVALAGFAIWKRRRIGAERFLLALVAAAGLGIYASGVLSGFDVKKAIEDLADALGGWTYALVGVMAFLETGAFVGLIAPGEFTVIVGGVIAGEGRIEILPLIGLTWLCCILGDTTSFFVGRKAGRQFLYRHGPRFKITHERLESVDKYFDAHGGKTILIGRFIGLVRAVAPFVAGASGMRYRRFIPYSIIGTGLWASFYLLLGFFFYRSFDRVAGVVGRATFVFACLVAIVVAAVWVTRRLRDEEDRHRFQAWVERQAERPLVQPFAAVARPIWRRVLRPTWNAVWPQVRFVWDRVTPGELGLELTTCMAVAGVGLYFFVALLMTVTSDLGPTALDTRVMHWAGDIRTDTGVTIAKIVTTLGSPVVVGSLVGIACALLAIRHRPVELGVLLASALAIWAAVHITKGAVDRPRPPHMLAPAAGSAYPSAHAAYSTIYVGMAVIAARVLPGIWSRATLVIAAVAAAAVIGASRIYLQVHWWSDVAGGWGLGAAIFGAVGAVGLIVGFLRNNGLRAPAPGERTETVT